MTSLLSISIGAVLLSGVIVPGLTQQAFAGTVSILDDLAPATFRNDPGSAFFAYTSFGDASACYDDPTGDPQANFSPNMALFASGMTDAPGTTGFSNMGPTDPVNGDGNDDITIPNWEDNFPLKKIRVQVSYCPNEPTSTSFPDPTITILDALGEDCGSTSNPTFNPSPVITGSNYFWQDFECEPNPDWEIINLSYDNGANGITIYQVVIDTVSEPPPSIGGTFEGVNTASLLVAGAQTNALWLIPLITAIGVGIVIARRQFF